MRVFAISLIAALMALTSAALADPTADLVAMEQSFSSVKSLHADITTEKGQHISIDMIMPDKFRESMPGGMEAVIIGTDAWMHVNGNWIKMPGTMPANRMGVRTAGIGANKPSDYTITDMGSSPLGGTPAEKYHLVNTKTNDVVDLWVGKDHLPLQAVVPSAKGGTTSIVYSEYNSVPDITPPQ